MKIEIAQVKDVPMVMDLIKQRCEWFQKEKIDQWEDDYLAIFDIQYFEEQASKKQVYLVTQEEKVCGAFVLKQEEEEYWKDKEKKKALYVYHLVTKVGYAGIGKQILEQIEELAREKQITYIRLDCMQNNKKLNAYYEQYGFKCCGEGKEEGYAYRLWEKKVGDEKMDTGNQNKQEKIKNWYKQTSCFTDLGAYKEFAKNLPEDMRELCLLQRHQIIHPFVFYDKNIRKQKHAYWGDMTKVPTTMLNYEDDIFPTAQGILAELLRRDSHYTHQRSAENKVHVTCRGQAILLASILKAKGIPARARSGFAFYVTEDNTAGDHWITEYYDEKEKRWILVDADMHDTEKITFNLCDMPREAFLFGAQAYLGLRNGAYQEGQIYYASEPKTWGLKAALRALFYDFHALMNDEIIFLHVPGYIKDKNFELSQEEYEELDVLAKYMLEPENYFEELQQIWNTQTKFRIMRGALN